MTARLKAFLRRWLEVEVEDDAPVEELPTHIFVIVDHGVPVMAAETDEMVHVYLMGLKQRVQIHQVPVMERHA